MTTRRPIEAWIADLGAEWAFREPAMGAGVLTAQERERASRYRAEAPARRFLRSRLVVRTLLARRVGASPAALRIAQTEAGKPFLVDHPRVHVSWSRCEDELMLAVTDDGPIGVDIERLRDVPGGAAVLATVRPGIADAGAVLDPLRFLSAWTLLEAAVKATGRGLAAGARDVALTLPAAGPCRLRTIADPGAARWHGRAGLLAGATAGGPLVAAVVAGGGRVSVRVERWPAGARGGDREGGDD